MTAAAEAPLQLPRIDRDARVVYAPIRHHSPECARQVRALIEEVRPDAVLIEAPRDAEALVPLLQDPDTVPPVALYCTWQDKTAGDAGHHASYYPLCEYSPEWVALRTAGELGARVRFIDLTYPEMVRAGRKNDDDRIASLQEEDWLRRSRFVSAAVRRAGVRDRDDLWDHWFEAAEATGGPLDFFDRVLAWCAASRQTGGDAVLGADGTLAREAHMAACIAEEPGRLVVVTGRLPTRRPWTGRLAERPCGAHRRRRRVRSHPDALQLRAARRPQRLRVRHALARLLRAALGRARSGAHRRRRRARAAPAPARAVGCRNDRRRRPGARLDGLARP